MHNPTLLVQTMAMSIRNLADEDLAHLARSLPAADLAEFVRKLNDKAIVELAAAHEPAARAQRAFSISRPRKASNGAATDLDGSLLDQLRIHGPSAISLLAAHTNGSVAQTRTALKRMMALGLVFMGGERRWSRYGLTQAAADSASRSAAAGGSPSPST